MYFVVNLWDNIIVAECLSYSEASIALENAVRESDRFYTEDDFTIWDEEDLEDYYATN